MNFILLALLLLLVIVTLLLDSSNKSCVYSLSEKCNLSVTGGRKTTVPHITWVHDIWAFLPSMTFTFSFSHDVWIHCLIRDSITILCNFVTSAWLWVCCEVQRDYCMWVCTCALFIRERYILKVLHLSWCNVTLESIVDNICWHNICAVSVSIWFAHQTTISSHDLIVSCNI